MARTHVVMAEEVLVEIDERVGERGRSRFIEEAAREKLARLELEEALEQTKGVVRGKRYGHWRDRATTARWVRKGRTAERNR